MPPKRKIIEPEVLRDRNHGALQHGDSAARTLRSIQLKHNFSRINRQGTSTLSPDENLQLLQQERRIPGHNDNAPPSLRQYGIFPPKFNGEGDYSTWWSDLHAYFGAFPEMADEQKIRILGSCISGSARMILDAAGPLTTVVAADHALRKGFAVSVNWTAKLWETVQMTNENVSHFYARLRLIVKSQCPPM